MSAVSFTVRRPTPPSHAVSGNDSDGSVFKVPALPSRLTSGSNTPSRLSKSQTLNSNGKRPANAFDGDSDSGPEDHVVEELVVGFDAMGAERAGGRPVKKDAPLVIAPLPNRDWRAVVKNNRNRAVPSYVPEGGEDKTRVGADGSQGGLGTRDTINSGPQQKGLIMVAPVTKRRKIDDEGEGEVKMEVRTEDEPHQDLTEDEKAVQAMLNAAKKTANGEEDGPEMEAIPLLPSAGWRQTKTEAEAFQEDVITRPNSCTLEDYQRVPVEQFGLALLRGMGWKPGTGASRSGKGPTEAFAPSSRPALLGLGAKEREALDDGRKGQKKSTRPNMRYVPVVAREKDASERHSESDRDRPAERRDRDRDGGDRSYSSSRRNSLERRSHRDREDRERDYDRDRVSDRDGRREGDRDRDRRRYDSDHRDRRRDEEEHDRKERDGRDGRDDRGERRSSRR